MWCSRSATLPFKRRGRGRQRSGASTTDRCRYNYFHYNISPQLLICLFFCVHVTLLASGSVQRSALSDRCAEKMGRREARSNCGTMSTSDASRVQCLLTASTCNQSGSGEVSPGHLGHNSNSGVSLMKTTTTTTITTTTTTATPVEVKKHQHKHNLKHRFEVMETLGKGAYGKVKKAVERTTQNTVRNTSCFLC